MPKCDPGEIGERIPEDDPRRDTLPPFPPSARDAIAPRLWEASYVQYLRSPDPLQTESPLTPAPAFRVPDGGRC